MICYKDKTFCVQTTCKHFGPCHRSLTEKVKADAAAAGLGVSQAAFTECFEPKEEEECPPDTSSS